MPTTDAQREAADRLAAEYPGRVQIISNVGPDSDLVVIVCPGGRTVILPPDGEPLADSVRNPVYDRVVIAGLHTRAGEAHSAITDEQVEVAWAAGVADYGGKWDKSALRVALEAAQSHTVISPEVAVAEDPVREAAREVVERIQMRSSFYEPIDRLREALAKPAPPCLTEDERRVAREALGDRLADTGVWNKETADALRSAAEKL